VAKDDRTRKSLLEQPFMGLLGPGVLAVEAGVTIGASNRGASFGRAWVLGMNGNLFEYRTNAIWIDLTLSRGNRAVSAESRLPKIMSLCREQGGTGVDVCRERGSPSGIFPLEACSPKTTGEATVTLAPL